MDVYTHTHTHTPGFRAKNQWHCLVFGVGEQLGFREYRARMESTKHPLNDHKQITGQNDDDS